MKDDVISRQAAIKDAESWVAVDEYEKHLQKNVVEWLKEFPPAEPQWIPVSEKLPERRKHYIVTDFGSVEEAYYTSDGHWFSIDGNKLKDVTAWMPLPEPFGGEQE